MKEQNSNEDPEYGNRIKKIRESLGFNQKDFAIKLGMAPSAISEIESQLNKPSYSVLKKFYDVFNINANYVLFGLGSPFHDDNNTKCLGDFDLGDKGEIILGIIQEMELSPLYMHSVIAYAENYQRTSRELIETDKQSHARLKQKKKELLAKSQTGNRKSNE